MRGRATRVAVVQLDCHPAAVLPGSSEPLEDPHGHPIPTALGDLQKRDLKPLHEFRPGQRVLIREVQDDRPDRLRHWHDQGLTPGVIVHFISYQPLDDMFNLQVGDVILRGLGNALQVNQRRVQIGAAGAGHHNLRALRPARASRRKASPGACTSAPARGATA
jgi:hypothetical protein